MIDTPLDAAMLAAMLDTPDEAEQTRRLRITWVLTHPGALPLFFAETGHSVAEMNAGLPDELLCWVSDNLDRLTNGEALRSD